MAATPVVAYYAAARYEVMPMADLDKLIDYAEAKVSVSRRRQGGNPEFSSAAHSHC